MRAHDFIIENSGGSKIYYHVSPNENREGIRREGLKPMTKRFKTVARTPGVFMFSDFTGATEWVLAISMSYPEISDVWRIKLPNSYEVVKDPSWDMARFNAVVTYQTIPPQYLSLVPVKEIKDDIFQRYGLEGLEELMALGNLIPIPAEFKKILDLFKLKI
jgi:hypothetical protein